MAARADKKQIGDARREEIMEYLRSFQAERGYMPTIAEISRKVGIRIQAVSQHLVVLRREGKVDYADGVMSRSLRLL